MNDPVFVIQYRHREPVSLWSIWEVLVLEDVAREVAAQEGICHPDREYRVVEYTPATPQAGKPGGSDG